MKIFNKNSILAALAAAFAIGLAGPAAVFAAGPAAVNLGSAGNFAILAKTGISTTGATSIVGNIGVSPAAATYLTGFGLMMGTGNVFSTSALVAGSVYASDYAAPTPTVMTTAISDMQTAYTDGAGRTNPTETEMGAGSIGGTTLVPGLYKWSTNVAIPTDMTLSGGPNDVWIFQIAGNLVMSSATHIVLSGGAQASNVFWVVAGNTTIGTTAVFNGNLLDQTTISLNTGATLNGRALAQAAVTLDSNTVTSPIPSAQVSVPPSTSAPTCATNIFYCVNTAAPTSTPVSTSTGTGTVVVTVPATNTNAALQAQLNQLLATLSSLQAQAAQQNSSASSQAARTIAVNLGMGSTGNAVATLQQFLISKNTGSAARILANAGATGYFGTLTQAALAEFQASAGISPAIGNFGAITRAYLSTH